MSHQQRTAIGRAAPSDDPNAVYNRIRVSQELIDSMVERFGEPVAIRHMRSVHRAVQRFLDRRYPGRFDRQIRKLKREVAR